MQLFVGGRIDTPGGDVMVPAAHDSAAGTCRAVSGKKSREKRVQNMRDRLEFPPTIVRIPGQGVLDEQPATTDYRHTRRVSHPGISAIGRVAAGGYQSRHE
jgi:hypothetical protein